MTKYESYKDNLSDFNLIDFYKEYKPATIILFPIIVYTWLLWILLCTGIFIGDKLFKY
jgi:hypothetical protein